MAMQYLEAPNMWTEKLSRPNVFLAGGISNCPDWQSEVVTALKNSTKLDGTDYTLYNPRRTNFQINDPKAAREQITWEHAALHASDIIVFWFSKGSDNPIVLFEYGVHMTRLCFREQPLKYIVVGCHPEYSRRLDVLTQTQLMHIRSRLTESIGSLEGAGTISDLIHSVEHVILSIHADATRK